MDNEHPNNFFLLTAILNSVSLTIPLIVLDAPILVIIVATTFCFIPSLKSSLNVFVTISTLYNLLLRPGLYVWALIVAISGSQDFFTIFFYVATALQAPGIAKNIFAYIAAFFKE